MSKAVHTTLELSGKAMSKSMHMGDVDLSPLRPVLANAIIPKTEPMTYPKDSAVSIRSSIKLDSDTTIPFVIFRTAL